MASLEDRFLGSSTRYTINGKDTGVLKNKLGITSQEELDTAERMITSYKLSKLYLDTGAQTFDTKHLVSIHKYLFSDIYEFAGKIRTEDTKKLVFFCRTQFIEASLSDIFKKARKRIPEVTDRDELLKFIVWLYSELDMTHPFREGNGRTIREMIRQYMSYVCEVNGLEPYYLDYNLIEDMKVYENAIIEADVHLNYVPLIIEFGKILRVKEPNKEEAKTK